MTPAALTVLRGARVVTPAGVLDGGWLAVAGATITAVGPAGAAPPSGPGTAVVDLPGGWLVPGFVDVHCHGAGGHDAVTADAGGLRAAAAVHAAHGTTSLLASLVSAPVEVLCRQLQVVAQVVAEGGSGVVGAHLEGPFLAPSRRGAHDPGALLAPDVAVLERLVAAGDGALRTITLAPELPGALELLDAAVAAGVVVAVGHTDATYDQAAAAFDRGATAATHLFNGMRPLHHREPGPVLAAVRSGAVLELINDGVHVHPALVAQVAAAHPDRVALVTDAMAATGLGDGRYALGGSAVDVRDGQVRLVDGGTLAGSTLTLDAAVARAVRACGLDVPAAVAASAATPARLLGLADRGALSAGARADVVHLDDALRVTRVLRAGQPAA